MAVLEKKKKPQIWECKSQKVRKRLKKRKAPWPKKRTQSISLPQGNGAFTHFIYISIFSLICLSFSRKLLPSSLLLPTENPCRRIRGWRGRRRNEKPPQRLRRRTKTQLARRELFSESLPMSLHPIRKERSTSLNQLSPPRRSRRRMLRYLLLLDPSILRCVDLTSPTSVRISAKWR